MTTFAGPMLKNTPFSPQDVRISLIQVLKSYFSDHPLYPWRENPSDSGVLIQEGHAIEARGSVAIPSVVVETTGLDPQPLGIGNYMDMVIDESTGEPNYLLAFSTNGIFNIYCIASGSVASESLAWEIYIFLLSLKEFSGRVLNVQFLSNPRISVPQKIKESGFDGEYVSVISTQFNITSSLTVKTKPAPGPTLREIDLVFQDENSERLQNTVLEAVIPEEPDCTPCAYEVVGADQHHPHPEESDISRIVDISTVVNAKYQKHKHSPDPKY